MRALRTLATCGAVVAATLLLPVVSAAPKLDDWHLEKSHDGIQIYSRAVAGWDIHETRGVARISGHLSSFAAVLDNVKSLGDLSPMVSGAEVVQCDGPAAYRYHARIDMPWPVTDREVYYQRTIAQNHETLELTVTDAVLAESPNHKGLVRMTKGRQQWRVTPLANGENQVEVQILSDPGGPIPSSLINMMSQGAPLDALQRMRRLVNDPRYVDADLPWIKERR